MPSSSKNTLHRWIEKDRKSSINLHRLPCNQGRHYAHGYGRKIYSHRIPERVRIENRPVVVEERKRLGYWEATTMHGARHQGLLVTLADRTSRFTLIAQVQHKEKVAVEQATFSLFRSLEDWVHTITFDNGCEFNNHQKTAKKLYCQTYFVAPYHSWERGAIENINRLIHEYLPKGMSFRHLTKQTIRKITARLNRRSQKCRGFKTPTKVFQQLSGIHYNLATGVAV